MDALNITVLFRTNGHWEYNRIFLNIMSALKVALK